MEDLNINTIELEQMRSQMSLLKEKLDKQEIINERLMRQAMNKRMSWIKNYIWFEISLVPFLLLLFGAMTHMLGLSWFVFAYLAVMLVVDVTADYYINHVDKNELLSGNLVEASRKLVRMKKLRAWSFFLSLIAVIVWVILFLIDLKRVAGSFEHDFLNGFATGGFFGGIVGGIIGIGIAFIIFHKMQRTNDDVIAQINAITIDDDQH